MIEGGGTPGGADETFAGAQAGACRQLYDSWFETVRVQCGAPSHSHAQDPALLLLIKPAESLDLHHAELCQKLKEISSRKCLSAALMTFGSESQNNFSVSSFQACLLASRMSSF